MLVSAHRRSEGAGRAPCRATSGRRPARKFAGRSTSVHVPFLRPHHPESAHLRAVEVSRGWRTNEDLLALGVLLLVGIALSNSWQLVLSHESDEDADPMG